MNVWQIDESFTFFVEKSTIRLISILSYFYAFHIHFSMSGNISAKGQMFLHDV